MAAPGIYDDDDYNTPAIPERLVVIPVDGGVAEFELYIMLLRVEGATWLIGDVNGHVTKEDLSELGVIPVAPDAPIPPECLPCVAFHDPCTEAFLARIRARAASLASVFGAPAVAVSSSASSAAFTWRYGDTSHALFGEAVDISLLGDPARFSPVGGCGVLVEVPIDDEEARGVFV